MPDLNKAMEEIRETYRQIGLTTSTRRKYELHRHLKKLWKEYNEAKWHISRLPEKSQLS